MSEPTSLQPIDVHILDAVTPAKVPRMRMGMGFLIGARHVLTCAHVVADAFDKVDKWLDEPSKPDVRVPLVFAFSRLHRTPIEAEIEAWWPQYSTIENRAELDDVALLRLPNGFVLPADVAPAKLSVLPPITNQPVSANGITAAEQNGVNLTGSFRDQVIGRLAFRSEGGDGTVQPGYSGAALKSGTDVIGMIAERQQKDTGLFIPMAILLEARPIADAVGGKPKSFIGAKTEGGAVSQSVAGSPGEWTRMSLGARLKRQLHDCDRMDISNSLESIIFAPRASRMPALGIFGCGADDLPTLLHDRFRIAFLVEAGHPKREVTYPPDKWTLQRMAWRAPRQSAAKAFAMMKRQLVHVTSADGPEPKKVRKALDAGESQAFYSEIPLDQIDAEDQELIVLWADYLAQIARSRRSLVHLLRVEPGAEQSNDALADGISTLAKAAGDREFVLDLGLLTQLSEDDLLRWLQAVADRVPLDGATLDALSKRATRELLAQTPPRLRQLREWLDTINH